MLQSLPESVLQLCCVRCALSTRDPWQWTCPACGPWGRMDVVYRPDAPRRMAERLPGRPFDMWRYRELLPLPDDAVRPAVVVGGTPVSESPPLARALGVGRIVLKDEGRSASGSLKDRASAIGVTLAHAAGKGTIACASTGNAASSTACMAASLGLASTIFVPRRAPEPKIAQLLVFGARVFRVDGDYDRAWDLCSELSAAQGWFDRNCAVNPWLVEGKKTAGLELAEQLGAAMTDWVAVGVGDGCTIAGIGKGLGEAVAAGLSPRMPRLLGVQPAGAQALVRAFHDGVAPHSEAPSTIADSLCVGTPRNPDKALAAVRRSGGTFVAVADAEIEDALRTLPRCTGVFGEPAAAAAVAGVVRAVALGIIGPGESVTIFVTGNGLKDPAAALRTVGRPIDVAPSREAVLAHLERAGEGAWGPAAVRA